MAQLAKLIVEKNKIVNNVLVIKYPAARKETWIPVLLERKHCIIYLTRSFEKNDTFLLFWNFVLTFRCICLYFI